MSLTVNIIEKKMATINGEYHSTDCEIALNGRGGTDGYIAQ
jgi:hypothetical protein